MHTGKLDGKEMETVKEGPGVLMALEYACLEGMGDMDKMGQRMVDTWCRSLLD